MKEYVCIKDFYIEDVKFASKGDYVMLLADNATVVNNSSEQKTANIPDIIKDREYFIPTFETRHFQDKPKDAVNHPDHYTWLKELCDIEVIDITRHMDFDLGNAIKYILRAGHKKEEGINHIDKAIQDLKKAVWYINDKINMLEYDKNRHKDKAKSKS